MAKKRTLERAIAGLLVVALALAMLPLGGMPAAVAQGTEVFVNEIHYDNDGTDAGEAIEIAGPAGTDLSGWSLVLYNGYNGTVYNTTSLSGLIPDQQDGFGTVAVSYPVNGLQNGSPDGLALIGPGPAVIQFLSYEGSFAAVDGPAAGMTSTDIGVAEPSDTALGDSLQLGGTGTVYEDFAWNVPAPHTFGAVNSGQTFTTEISDSDGDGVPDDVDNCPDTYNPGQEDGDGDGVGDVCDGCPSDPGNDADSDGVCGDVDNCPYTYNPGQEDADGDGIGDACEVAEVSIYDIQYTTDPSGDSPYDDGVVTTEGVVTAAFSSGYFIEDPAGGAWNGLWVYDTTNTPDRGDAVRLTGTVDEYYNLTELTDVSEYAALSTGNTLPEPVVVTAGAANDEQYESVLLRVESVQVIAGEDAYYEWVVDDGSGPLVVDNLGTDTHVPVVGEELAAVIGPLNYNYGAFKIAPRDDDDIIFPAPPSPFIINEVDSDTPSYDELEFIELYDGGVGSSALDGLVVVLFNGSSDTSYLTFDLDGYATDVAGYFVIGSVDGADIYVDPGSQGWLQNGTDAVALYSGDATGFPYGTAVTTDNLLDALVYDTNDGDDSGLLVLLNEGQAQINEDGSGDKDNQSNQRCPNGEGGARNTDTYTQFVPTPGAANCELPPPPFIINEVDSDTPSYDDLEFIELYDGGAGNMALDGLVVVLFNGSDDASYEPAFDLDGYATDPNGYFVIGSVPGADIYVDPGSQGWLQNGADAIALYSGDAADFTNDTAVTTDNLLDALVYDTNDGDDSGLLVLLNEGQAQINEDGSGDKDNQSNQRCPNGEGGARNTDTYTQSAPTPGWANCEPPPEQCGDDYIHIYTIQGNSLASDLDGDVVSTEGIVVGDFQDGKSGYFIQDAEGDGFDDTSDGIFVYGTSPDVSVGDHVRVRGYVDEYYELTEITSVSQVWVCSTGNELPAPAELSLPVEDLDDFEPFEGMLVTFPQALVISEYYNFDRYGEIVLTSERQNTPTAVEEPGEDAIALAAENALDRITLDDGRGSQNPDPAIHPNGLEFTLDNLFRGGDLVSNVTGVLDYSYSLYRIQPTQGADYTPANPRTEVPDGVGEPNVKVASFNVLNYFTTIDDGDWICGPSEDMECRGADTTEEYERQRDKIVSALAAMDADVVGLIEIENNLTDYPTADLVYWLNEALDATAYDYIATGAIGTDAIRQAFIYKPATVTPVGGYAVLDSTVDARFLDDYNRPALAQTFMDNATGGTFTVAVNHLKSKGSACDAIGDPDTGDGSGNCNLTRTAAAEALVDWLASYPTGSGDDDYLIIGDLNSYDKEDPIDVLLAGGYTDLVYEYLGEYAYSYVFDGAVGYLDHGLANGALVDRVTGATIWHINADEPDLIDYDMSYKLDAQDALYEDDAYRSSDHDPVIVGLCTDETPPTAEVTLSRDILWPPNHKYVTVHAWVDADDNFDRHLTVNLVSVTSSQPDDGLGDGDMPDDIVILSDHTFKLRAERMGGDEDRIYTIIYTATDDCGNVTFATATVTVPHDMGR